MTSEEIMNPFENVQKWNAFHLVCLKTEFLPLPNVNRIKWKSILRKVLRLFKGTTWIFQREIVAPSKFLRAYWNLSA
jgi:hypothetical protein